MLVSALRAAAITHAGKFFFNEATTPEIYTLSLHDALPILLERRARPRPSDLRRLRRLLAGDGGEQDRKSTRLNSSHPSISYAVFCLKKKNTPLDGWSDCVGRGCRSASRRDRGHSGCCSRTR